MYFCLGHFSSITLLPCPCLIYFCLCHFFGISSLLWTVCPCLIISLSLSFFVNYFAPMNRLSLSECIFVSAIFFWELLRYYGQFVLVLASNLGLPCPGTVRLGRTWNSRAAAGSMNSEPTLRRILLGQKTAQTTLVINPRKW